MCTLHAHTHVYVCMHTLGCDFGQIWSKLDRCSKMINDQLTLRTAARVEFSLRRKNAYFPQEHTQAVENVRILYYHVRSLAFLIETQVSHTVGMSQDLVQEDQVAVRLNDHVEQWSRFGMLNIQRSVRSEGDLGASEARARRELTSRPADSQGDAAKTRQHQSQPSHHTQTGDDVKRLALYLRSQQLYVPTPEIPKLKSTPDVGFYTSGNQHACTHYAHPHAHTHPHTHAHTHAHPANHDTHTCLQTWDHSPSLEAHDLVSPLRKNIKRRSNPRNAGLR